MSTLFEDLFLHTSLESQKAYRKMMHEAIEVLIRDFASANRPYSGIDVERLTLNLQEKEICPEEPMLQLPELLSHVGKDILQNSAIVTHPNCIAHLHCPPLNSALVAELFIAATNQSMDSWDQSMAATVVEERVVEWLCTLFGYGPYSDGVFTSGGTQSNFMGLLLARDHFAMREWGWNIQQQGLPPEANRMRVLCSEKAHFTVKQSLALLGLGEKAVVSVEVDEHFRMRPDDLEHKLEELHKNQMLPFALVATVGTTDFGSIDPLPTLVEIAHQHQMWIHADAAYGGALALSKQNSHLVLGLERVDSITVDFHKLFYQPISCGAFLVKDKSSFRTMRMLADYLNPEQDEIDGVPNLVTKSIQTTRRFDALKLYISLQYLGRKKFAEMIDYSLQLAKETAQIIKHDLQLQLLGEPTMNTVVFRYVPREDIRAKRVSIGIDSSVEKEVCNEIKSKIEVTVSNDINSKIRAKLLTEGTAVLARTVVDGKTCLKFTLLNPRTQLKDIEAILQKVKEIGEMLESEYGSQHEVNMKV